MTQEDFAGRIGLTESHLPALEPRDSEPAPAGFEEPVERVRSGSPVGRGRAGN
jgi:hypothetical protein